MMLYKLISPSMVKATIQLPASKSISNRALIINALGKGIYPPENLSDCDDTQVMIKALTEGKETIDIMAAGTAMRFLTAYLSATSGERIITGTARMQQRPIQILVELTEMMQKGLSGFRRFLDVVETEPEIVNAPDAESIDEVNGHVSYENVSFHYSDDDTPVLSNVTFDIPAGKSVALVGPSGSGKTTICSLLPRFYDVTGGRVTIDGKDVRDLTLESLRNQIGLVQQDVYLFSGTIYENIAYGRPGASKEDVINAAKRAGAHEFIMGLKDGYDTYVGERGVKLSGGQKQRISIARVFLKNPPIIILDEATSALDNESEFAVAKSLGELSEGRTTLTIAHRLSSIRNSDRILVLTDDGIVEEGNHDQLMEQKGIYYQFYETANALK